MAWILIIQVSTWGGTINVTYPSLAQCNAAKDMAYREVKAALCIPAPRT